MLLIKQSLEKADQGKPKMCPKRIDLTNKNQSTFPAKMLHDIFHIKSSSSDMIEPIKIFEYLFVVFFLKENIILITCILQKSITSRCRLPPSIFQNHVLESDTSRQRCCSSPCSWRTVCESTSAWPSLP